MEKKCENCMGRTSTYCNTCINNIAKPQTNREWLESLSDEEFNEFVAVSCNRCIYQPCNRNYANCTKGTLAWLQAEHKE